MLDLLAHVSDGNSNLNPWREQVICRSLCI